MSLLATSSLSRTEISPIVGEEGEDEDEEERLSCFIGVREVDEDAEEELDKPGMQSVFLILSQRECVGNVIKCA